VRPFPTRFQGPRIAKTMPGSWMLAKSTLPSAENVGPVNSLSLISLRASAYACPAR
jgi:hypothetical protein